MGKRKVVELPEKIAWLLDELVEEIGYPNRTSASITAIIDFHRRMMTKHVRSTYKPPVEVIKEPKNKGYRICEELGGKSKGGFCTFTTYYYTEKAEKTLPLGELTEEMVLGQYDPDKETCLKS